jgi:tetratricopeptide (TPR) repeat protein
LNARPSFRQAQFHLISALLKTNRMPEAKVTMEVYQRNYPDDATVRHLYGQHFGGRDALNDAVALAREANEPGRDLPLDAYVGRARRLFLQALRARQLDTHQDLVISLLEKAIAEGPAEPVGYDELVRVHLTRENAEQAAAVLARADAAGIPNSDLLMARAGEALSGGRTDDALGVYERQLSTWGEAPRLDDLILWANMFARAAGADAGVRVIDLAKERGLVTGKNAVSLEVEKISMFANAGDLDRALEILHAVEETVEQSKGSMNAIRYRTEGLIPLLVQQDVRSNFQVAEDLVKRLREDYPQEQGYPVLYARLLMSQDPVPDGAGEKAKKLLQGVLRRTPSHADAMMALSSIVRAEGAGLPRSQDRQLIEEEAFGYARDAAFQNPDNWRAQLLLATIQLERGQPEAAATTLANVVDIYPNDKRLLLALVEAYRIGKKYFDAHSVLGRVGVPSELDEETARKVSLALTRLELDEGKVSTETLNRLQTRYEENPESLSNALELARALALQGDVDEGAALVEGLASDNAKPATVWAALGRYYIRAGQAYLKDARAAFTKAKIYDPLQPTALKGLIELHLNARNYDTALSLSDTFLTKVYAEDHYVLYRKSGTLFAMGKPEEALAPINKAIELLSVPNADYLFLRARVHMVNQEFDAALSDLRVVTGLGVSSAFLLDLAKAEAYFGKGEVETAQSFVSSAKNRPDASNSIMATELARVTALGASL